MTLPIWPVSLLLFLAQEASSPVRVDFATKGWQLGKRPIASGEKLSALAELTTKEPADLLLDCDSGGAILYTCVGPCTVPVCSMKVNGVKVVRIDSPSEPAFLSRVSSMFASWRKRDPKTPDTLGVRAGAGGSDAVVWQTAGALHLGPALRRVQEGRYCFRLTKLPGATPLSTLTLAWDRSVDSEGIVSVPNLTPGTYALEISHAEASCDFNDPTGAPAWIVVTNQTDFDRIGEQWKSCAPWLRELEESDASPAALLTLRHAILSSLGDSIEKP